MKVITIDDSSTMRRIIKNTLKRIGYGDEILEAENGKEALDILASNDVDLIITDWNMPVMDGLTFVKKIRSDHKYDDIPIIMVTTEAAKEDIITALKAGVNNYIVKPFTPQVLKEKIEAVLGLKD
ncbi:response regulator [Hippea maritima]|uniref:Response regulator receiver protein n=1 Tax=Hippea maritima (strain ATCC 700847 / DSM 10411 / MH2) TaxID=760142 RepID=F2LTK9_HIPMA|nr:response regulator [Hippea maritima]AEA33334.1 response regulator receiver protein [Hippea maritima DSM 10411]